MPKFRYDLAACVLIEALFTTDAEACKKYGITERTLHRYRQRLVEDSVLEHLFAEKKRALDDKWADVLPNAMREAVHAIAEISKELRTNPATRRNPVSLERLAGALKLCADVYYTGKVIDARIADRNRPPERVLGPGSPDAVPDYSD